MRSVKPWTQIADVRQEMDRLFDLVFASRWDEFPATGDSLPSLELTETEDALVLKMEVPGMNATFKNGLLVVTLPKARAAKGSTVPVKRRVPNEIVLPT
jgi:HSP20 family molecular chaperone IbpA